MVHLVWENTKDGSNSDIFDTEALLRVAPDELNNEVYNDQNYDHAKRKVDTDRKAIIIGIPVMISSICCRASVEDYQEKGPKDSENSHSCLLEFKVSLETNISVVVFLSENF